VKVQSSWFCSKRRRKLGRQGSSVRGNHRQQELRREDSLLFGNAVAAHALPRIVEPRQDILRHDVARSDDTDTDGDRHAVLAHPAPRRGEHGWKLQQLPQGGDSCEHKGLLRQCRIALDRLSWGRS
jgi:hypothetical protein